MNTFDKFEVLREALGDDTTINELIAWLGSLSLDDFVSNTANMWDVEIEEDCE